MWRIYILVSGYSVPVLMHMSATAVFNNLIPHPRATVTVCTVLVAALAVTLSGCARDAHQMRVAASSGDLAAVKEIVERNRRAVNSSDDFFPHNTTPLHWAAGRNHYDVAYYLVSHKADVNAVNQDGDTPLHYAATGGSEKLVALLLSSGARVDAVNESGDTPLSRALSESNLGAARRLLDAGASYPPVPHVAAALGNIPMLSKEMKNDPAVVNARDKQGMTPLHYAAINNQAKAVDVLIAEGAKLQHADSYGFVPLHLAAEKGADEAVAKLITTGADVNAQNSFGLSPLHMAASNNRAKAVRLLASSGAKLEAKTENGQTPLIRAIVMAGVMRCDNLAAVQALLNCGADLNAASSDGYTALHYAAAHAEFGMVRVLVEAGADLDRRNGESLTPLELAKDRSRIQTGMDYSRVIAYLTKQSEKRPPVRHAPNADYQRMDVPKSTREAPRQKNSRAQRGN